MSADMAKESSQQWLSAIAVLVVACLVGLVAPHYVPETPGSPGTIVAVLLLWFLGSSLGVVGIALAAKAVVSKRRKAGHGQKPSIETVARLVPTPTWFAAKKADAESQFMDKAVGAVPRTVCIGGMRKDEILSALKQKGIQLNEIAQTLLAHRAFEVADARSTIEIAEVSVRDLGFTRGATLGQVFERAAEHGLALCPLELAAHLRLQFTDQPEGFVGYPPSAGRAPPGALTIAVRPIASGDGVPMGFYLRRICGVHWLRGYRSPAEHIWDADDRFVFRRLGKDQVR